MATYNEAGVTYNDPAFLYDGIELGDPLTLIVDGADVTDELAYGSLGVRVGTHGNTLGTLDAKLNDPAALPAVEDSVDLYVAQARRYRGTVKATTADEYTGGHVFASFSAQDSGPDGGIPTAAPFNVSDDPDGVTTHGYHRLSMATRTTEGGSPKTTANLVVKEDGLWAGQNIEVTSANHGLSAEEFTIVDVSAAWPNPEAPEYTLSLGEPLVSLAEVVTEHEIPDDSITSTKISDGAISTPKLAANAVTTAKLDADAVIANVANVADTVVIDATGLAVTGGAITVTNPTGTVVIDGTSNMFKIQATGTLDATAADPGASPASSTGTNATATLSGLGTFTSTPGVFAFVGDDFTTPDERFAGLAFTRVDVDEHDIFGWKSYATVHSALNGSNQAVVTLLVRNFTAGSTRRGTCRYHLVQEAAI